MKAPNSGKTMFSVLFCVSATGVYLPPFTVYKSKNLYEFIWCLDDGGGSHDVVDWVLAADHNNGVDVKMLKEGILYVLAAYEGSYFPGLVTKLKKTSVEVSCMSKSGLLAWKWPAQPDIHAYPPQDIKAIINPPRAINKRNNFSVPEADNYWM